MALSPILVIGCGGSGGKVILGLRRRIEQDLRRRGWNGGIPDAWQLKWIDVPTLPESHNEFGSPLPLGDYVGLAPVDDYRLIDSALVSGAGASSMERLVGWRPTPNLPLPVSKGAGQMRGVGRAVALANTRKVTEMVEDAFAAMAGGTAQLAELGVQLRASTETSATPAVFVISSMAGGTGAGIFIDVCDVIRANRPEVSNQIFGFMFTAEIFKGVNADSGMAPNTVASLAEVISGYLSVARPVESLYGTLGAVAAVGKSGPSWPFVIGMQPMGGGAPLESPAQCYRAVTETILASMTNDRFMQDFVNYQVVNYGPNSGADYRLTAYQMLNQSLAEGAPTQACGVVSSFGSAIVSVGSASFGEWACDRLARSVLDHVVHGWRDTGRQLMGDQATSSTTNDDVIAFLVGRERQLFIDRCGLWEEDEPNGIEHDQVLDGILPTRVLKEIRDRFRGSLITELSRAAENTASGWLALFENLLSTRQSGFRGDVEKAILEGSDGFGAQVVTRVGAAVSEWLAKFGVPVTLGLVQELRSQCMIAIEQLRMAATKHHASMIQETAPFVLGAFQRLGNKKAPGNSTFVSDGLAQALGPQSWYAMKRRDEAAIDLLDRVVQRVIKPLQEQLKDVGAALDDKDSAKQRGEWPDGGGSVSAAYQPSPTEKVLLATTEWDREYKRLLSLSAGSVNEARDEVAAGGFPYGSVVNPKTAPVMISFDAHAVRWWERDGGSVSVNVRLRPAEVKERAQSWLWNENHAAGKFVRMGLEEYLSEVGDQRTTRLSKFAECLTNARELAQPLVRINANLMQQIHPNKTELSVQMVCEPFPFPPAMTEARQTVERVMFRETAPDGGWFMTGNTSGRESVLMTAVLDNAVQPATVTSLTEPIAKRWDQICSTDLNFRQAAIKGFWTYNRARLLTESIPLPEPSIRKITQGWFIGRLLGLVTAATETEPFRVRYTDNGRTLGAPLPWPLLRHRDTEELHLRSHQAEWLPALFEHVCLAMMLVGQDSQALDGYEQLYRLGSRGRRVLEDWIINGAVPAEGGDPPQLKGTNPEERKAGALEAIESLSKQYSKRRADAQVVGDWNRFVQIPYGFELLPLMIETLSDLGAQVHNIETVQEFG